MGVDSKPQRTFFELKNNYIVGIVDEVASKIPVIGKRDAFFI